MEWKHAFALINETHHGTYFTPIGIMVSVLCSFVLFPLFRLHASLHYVLFLANEIKEKQRTKHTFLSFNNPLCCGFVLFKLIKHKARAKRTTRGLINSNEQRGKEGRVVRLF